MACAADTCEEVIPVVARRYRNYNMKVIMVALCPPLRVASLETAVCNIIIAY